MISSFEEHYKICLKEVGASLKARIEGYIACDQCDSPLMYFIIFRNRYKWERM